jgi:Fe-S cluster assembly protein SufD
VSALLSERDRVVAGFGDRAATLAEGAPAWLPPLRRAAIERFAELGFPTRKREDWKYTNAAPIARALATAPPAADAPSPRELAAAAAVAQAKHRLVFVNGHFAPEASSRTELPAGAVVENLSRVLRDRPELVESHWSRVEPGDDRAFVALNSAFQRDGAFVALEPGVVLEEPIELVFVSGGVAGLVSHTRNLVVLAESAAAIVVERHIALDDSPGFSNAVTEIELAANSRLDHVVLELASPNGTHLATSSTRLGADARFRSHTISLGAALARHEVSARLAGTGAECELNGLYIADGDRHVDCQTTIDHAFPAGTSRQLFKGILGGSAHGIFNGKVIVRPGAQKTSAVQSNPNLLLSDSAEIDTRPNLEIFADDVQCAHGASVGRLDDDALFFLRARGIGEDHARRMLCHAFAAEVVEAIPWEPLRDEILQRVSAAFGGDGGDGGAGAAT